RFATEWNGGKRTVRRRQARHSRSLWSSNFGRIWETGGRDGCWRPWPVTVTTCSLPSSRRCPTFWGTEPPRSWLTLSWIASSCETVQVPKAPGTLKWPDRFPRIAIPLDALTVIPLITGLYLVAGLLMLLLWWTTGQDVWVTEFFRVPGKVLLVA